MATGDLRKLGTLYVNNQKQRNPRYPWRSDSAAPGQATTGDIPAYTSGTIEIRNTDAADDYKIKWREVNIDGKLLLVADRNILASVSWDTLNAQGLVFGKEITIDGRKYSVRLMTGGTDRRSGDSYAGGTPISNDWDRIITNEDRIAGLPSPVASDLDKNADATDMNSAHNKFWNWFYMWSWCQDTYAGGASSRCYRGSTSARYYPWPSSSYTYAHHGFRPVLEALDTAPLISDNDRDLGEYASPLKYSFSVAEGDGGEKFSLKIYLDSGIHQTYTNQTARSYTIDFTAGWLTMEKGKHTIRIVAENGYGIEETRTLTFTKVGSVPNPPQIRTPKDSSRPGADFYLQFFPGVDPDGDDLSVKVEVSDTSDFATVQAFTGLEKKVDNEWVATDKITAFDYNTAFRVHVTGLAANAIKYIRVATKDDNGSGFTVYSPGHKITTATRLAIQTKPQEVADRPQSINIKDIKTVDPKATIRVHACNNALDTAPAWEDMTEDYVARRAHTFTNTVKAAEKWAVAIKYDIAANDATGEISISVVGCGVETLTTQEA